MWFRARARTCWVESSREGPGEAAWSCREPHYTQQEPHTASSLLAVLTNSTVFNCTNTHTHAACRKEKIVNRLKLMIKYVSNVNGHLFLY